MENTQLYENYKFTPTKTLGNYSFFLLESPLEVFLLPWTAATELFSKFARVWRADEKYFCRIPCCFIPGSSTMTVTIRYVRSKLSMVLPSHAQNMRPPVTTTKYVLGFDSFIDFSVLVTYEAVPQSDAIEVMICSYLRSWAPVQWWAPTIQGTTCGTR